MKLDGQEVTLKFNKYNNGNLALQLFDEEGFPYASITVNLYDELSNSNCAFIDTNNCGDEIIGWLEDNNLGYSTGRYGKSGFCIYPEFEFNEDVINE